MENIIVYDQNVKEYENWFIKNDKIFQSEVEAIRQLIPAWKNGIEIGAGTGLFSEKLGLKRGIEPSYNMRQKAIERGLDVIDAVGEEIPLDDKTCDFVLMVTVDCVLKDIFKCFKETWRILENEGYLVIAFIDRETPLGALYDEKKNESVFYENANFHSSEEIRNLLKIAGFNIVDERQTVFSFENKLHKIKKGTGEGVFAIIKAKKSFLDKINTWSENQQ